MGGWGGGGRDKGGGRRRRGGGSAGVVRDHHCPQRRCVSLNMSVERRAIRQRGEGEKGREGRGEETWGGGGRK